MSLRLPSLLLPFSSSMEEMVAGRAMRKKGAVVHAWGVRAKGEVVQIVDCCYCRCSSHRHPEEGCWRLSSSSWQIEIKRMCASFGKHTVAVFAGLQLSWGKVAVYWTVGKMDDTQEVRMFGCFDCCYSCYHHRRLDEYCLCLLSSSEQIDLKKGLDSC